MKFICMLFAAIGFALSSVNAQEQQLSPRAVAKTENIEVTYGQPSKRERVIFGDLVPYGEVWRAGANEATEITFKKNGSFGGKSVEAGTYSLFSIPKQKEWVIILNKSTEQWGAYDYEKIKDKDVLQVTVPTYQLKNTEEKLTYKVNKDALQIEWDRTGVAIPVKF